MTDLHDNTAGHGATLAAFEAAAVGAALVTFDVFDTLLLRIAREPTDIFHIVAASFDQDAPALAAVFADGRIAAEAAVRARPVASGRGDISLAEIYASLPADVLAAAEGAGVPLAALMAREIDIEVACAIPDDEVVAVFHRIVATRVPVAIVSDMYLPRRTLDRLLQVIGVAGHVALYLSCEADGCKAEGTIWQHIRRDRGLSDDAAIVHLGDHPQSDGAVARANGIQAFELSAPSLRRSLSRLAKGDHWFLGACVALLDQARRRHADDPTVDPYWLTLAYLIVLPVTMGMCKYLVDLGAGLEIENFFFLARDGLIFQRVFEAAFRRPGMPASGYIWASRRCLNMANITVLDDTTLNFLTSGVHLLSPVEYLRRIDIDLTDPAIIAAIAQRFDDPDKSVTSEDLPRVRDLLLAVEPAIVARAAIEREALLVHLDQLGVFKQRALVMDLGWHGSLQRSLLRLGRIATGGEVDMEGAYLGTMGDTLTELDGRPIHLHGWLFEQGRPLDVMAKTVDESVEVIELLFSAPRPGVRYLKLVDGDIEVVRAGTPAEAHRIVISRLFHKEVETAAGQLAHLASYVSATAFRDLAVQQLATLLQQPDTDDIRHFRVVHHAEGFGEARYSPIIPFAPPVFMPKALVEADRTAFWRRAFRAGLSAPQRAVLATVNVIGSASYRAGGITRRLRHRQRR